MWLQLTSTYLKRKVWINMTRVGIMHVDAETNDTLLDFSPEKDYGYYKVKETPDEIIQMIINQLPTL